MFSIFCRIAKGNIGEVDTDMSDERGQSIGARYWTRVLSLALVGLAMLSLLACTHNDGPPSPDTPEPPAHYGAFVSGYGALFMYGDGSTIVVRFSQELADAVGVPANQDLQGTYAFTFGSRGLCRYDVADRLVMRVAGKDVKFTTMPGANLPDKITIAWPFQGHGPDIVFEKKPSVSQDELDRVQADSVSQPTETAGAGEQTQVPTAPPAGAED